MNDKKELYWETTPPQPNLNPHQKSYRIKKIFYHPGYEFNLEDHRFSNYESFENFAAGDGEANFTHNTEDGSPFDQALCLMKTEKIEFDYEFVGPACLATKTDW